jgi:hypothetical protein
MWPYLRTWKQALKDWPIGCVPRGVSLLDWILQVKPKLIGGTENQSFNAIAGHRLKARRPK